MCNTVSKVITDVIVLALNLIFNWSSMRVLVPLPVCKYSSSELNPMYQNMLVDIFILRCKEATIQHILTLVQSSM